MKPCKNSSSFGDPLQVVERKVWKSGSYYWGRMTDNLSPTSREIGPTTLPNSPPPPTPSLLNTSIPHSIHKHSSIFSTFSGLIRTLLSHVEPYYFARSGSNFFFFFAWLSDSAISMSFVTVTLQAPNPPLLCRSKYLLLVTTIPLRWLWSRDNQVMFCSFGDIWIIICYQVPYSWLMTFRHAMSTLMLTTHTLLKNQFDKKNYDDQKTCTLYMMKEMKCLFRQDQWKVL